MTDGVEPKPNRSPEGLAAKNLEQKAAPESESARESNEPGLEKEAKPTAAEKKPGELLRSLRKPKMPIPQVRDETVVRIEKILEAGVGDAYARLSPVAQQEFKIKGEETAQKINELLKATHVKVKKIFQLILEWLRLLPGINRFFLEQEAKIKTDRLLEVHKKLKG